MSFFAELMAVYQAKKIAREMREEEIRNNLLFDEEDEEDPEPTDEELREMGYIDENGKPTFFWRHPLLCLSLKALVVLVIVGGCLTYIFWPILKELLPFLIEMAKWIFDLFF